MTMFERDIVRSFLLKEFMKYKVIFALFIK